MFDFVMRSILVVRAACGRKSGPVAPRLASLAEALSGRWSG